MNGIIKCDGNIDEDGKCQCNKFGRDAQEEIKKLIDQNYFGVSVGEIFDYLAEKNLQFRSPTQLREFMFRHIYGSENYTVISNRYIWYRPYKIQQTLKKFYQEPNTTIKREEFEIYTNHFHIPTERFIKLITKLGYVEHSKKRSGDFIKFSPDLGNPKIFGW